MHDFLKKFVERATSIFSLIGGLGIFLMLLHVTADVVLRQVFGFPPPATVLVVSHYYMVMIAFFPLGWSELRGDMISVEVLSGLFKGKILKIKTILIDLLIAAVYGFLAIHTWIIAMSEFKVGSYQVSLGVVIPIWPSYFILPIAFGVACFVVLLRIYFYISPNDESDSEQGMAL
ncbi:MAG: TRAP transporter small permease [Alphaproteobacteria bacterium]|nr:TRAP transporter small permease [Alphaproteobacteria bacterium]